MQPAFLPAGGCHQTSFACSVTILSGVIRLAYCPINEAPSKLFRLPYYPINEAPVLRLPYYPIDKAPFLRLLYYPIDKAPSLSALIMPEWGNNYPSADVGSPTSAGHSLKRAMCCDFWFNIGLYSTTCVKGNP